MQHLTTTQVTLLVAAVGIAGGFLGWLGRGFGFVAGRWWTAAPKHERAAYMNSVADLAVKLRTNGMTLDDVRSVEAIMLNPTVMSSEAAVQVVTQLTEVPEPNPFESNVAMKARTGASYSVAEAKLDQALTNLRLLIRDDEDDLLLGTQEAWKAYRRTLEDRALREYLGGTHATLAMALAGLSETERRTQEIMAEIQERRSR